jgi:hypothetical protein
MSRLRRRFTHSGCRDRGDGGLRVGAGERERDDESGNLLQLACPVQPAEYGGTPPMSRTSEPATSSARGSSPHIATVTADGVAAVHVVEGNRCSALTT